MSAAIFRSNGKTIVNFMSICFSKPAFLAQSWVRHSLVFFYMVFFLSWTRWPHWHRVPLAPLALFVGLRPPVPKDPMGPVGGAAPPPTPPLHIMRGQSPLKLPIFFFGFWDPETPNIFRRFRSHVAAPAELLPGKCPYFVPLHFRFSSKSVKNIDFYQSKSPFL